MKRHTIISSGAALAVFLCMGLLVGCVRDKKTEVATRAFPVVSIPEIYSDSYEDRMEYITEHFWDDFTDTTKKYLCDSTHIGGVLKGDVEQQVSTYVALLQFCSLDQACKSVRILYSKLEACEKADTSSNIFDGVVPIAERYLYDPNSPGRDEDIYAAFASRLSEYEGFSPEVRGRYAFEVAKSSLNRRGTQAADFYFTDSKGRMTSLFGVNAEYTLLFFSNPGCEACYEIITILTEQLNVSEMIESGQLAVVNVYIDEDIEAWFDYMPIYPKNWHNGYDAEGIIRTDGRYYVRAIPSLYLLDRDKIVLMKDAPNDRVFNALATIASEGVY